MREVFQQELREVQERLVEISELVTVAITNATAAFNESNVTLAETVIAEDEPMASLYIDLPDAASNVVPLRGPLRAGL